MDITIVIFIAVYGVMALGHLPGFQLDRTGAALVGAMLLIATGQISPGNAWSAIDFNTIGLLFGLMVVSSAFVNAGFYAHVAARLGNLLVSPPTLLAIKIGVTAGLSALLTNNIVMVAMVPLLCSISLARGFNPVPFLLGACFAANIGATATLIGSPNNMLIAQVLHLSFSDFSRITLLPVLISLLVVWLVLVLIYRKHWQLTGSDTSSASLAKPTELESIYFDRTETSKAGLVAFATIAAFIFTDWPHVVIAMAAASVLLLNRQVSSHRLLANVDGNLLLLMMGLFVVNATMKATGLPADVINSLHKSGVNLHAPLQALLISAGISDIVGNTPAVMLLEPFVSNAKSGLAQLGTAIAMGTGFSSNIVIFGSLAGIIAVEQAAAHGIKIGAAEFARAGLPVTVISLLLGIASVALQT